MCIQLHRQCRRDGCTRSAGEPSHLRRCKDYLQYNRCTYLRIDTVPKQFEPPTHFCTTCLKAGFQVPDPVRDSNIVRVGEWIHGTAGPNAAAGPPGPTPLERRLKDAAKRPQMGKHLPSIGSKSPSPAALNIAGARAGDILRQYGREAGKEALRARIEEWQRNRDADEKAERRRGSDADVSAQGGSSELETSSEDLREEEGRAKSRRESDPFKDDGDNDDGGDDQEHHSEPYDDAANVSVYSGEEVLATGGVGRTRHRHRADLIKLEDKYSGIVSSMSPNTNVDNPFTDHPVPPPPPSPLSAHPPPEFIEAATRQYKAMFRTQDPPTMSLNSDIDSDNGPRARGRDRTRDPARDRCDAGTAAGTSGFNPNRRVVPLSPEEHAVRWCGGYDVAADPPTDPGGSGEWSGERPMHREIFLRDRHGEENRRRMLHSHEAKIEREARLEEEEEVKAKGKGRAVDKGKGRDRGKDKSKGKKVLKKVIKGLGKEKEVPRGPRREDSLRGGDGGGSETGKQRGKGKARA